MWLDKILKAEQEDYSACTYGDVVALRGLLENCASAFSSEDYSVMSGKIRAAENMLRERDRKTSDLVRRLARCST